jgi:hypothetical protein
MRLRPSLPDARPADQQGDGGASIGRPSAEQGTSVPSRSTRQA